jgi:hypothetical protein
MQVGKSFDFIFKHKKPSGKNPFAALSFSFSRINMEI